MALKRHFHVKIDVSQIPEGIQNWDGVLVSLVLINIHYVSQQHTTFTFPVLIDVHRNSKFWSETNCKNSPNCRCEHQSIRRCHRSDLMTFLYLISFIPCLSPFSSLSRRALYGQIHTHKHSYTQTHMPSFTPTKPLRSLDLIHEFGSFLGSSGKAESHIEF